MRHPVAKDDDHPRCLLAGSRVAAGMVTGSAPRGDWRIVLAVWAVMVLLLGARTVVEYGTVPFLRFSDDAMRIVTATDVMNGQDWQDIVQHRDNAPFGAEMHWSRLIDAPIAALIAIVRPFSGQRAPDVAAAVWPLLLLLPLLALCSATVRRLVPRSDGVTAVALPLVSLVLTLEFLPGRVDHHNVQIVLMLAAALILAAWRDRATGGLLLGLVLATSVAIGLETLPFVAVALGAMALIWARDSERYWLPAVTLGTALAAGVLVHFLVAVAPSRYAVSACDMLSIRDVAGFGLGGLAFAAVAALATPLRHPGARIAAMIVAAGAVATVVALSFPTCLSGPYAAVDDRVSDLVYAGIAEAQTLWRRLADDPAAGVAFALPALAAIAVSARATLRAKGENRIDWLIVSAFLLAAVGVMLIQIRGARFAAAFAVPAASYLITVARTRYVAKASTANVIGLLGSWLLFAGVLQYAVIGWLAPRPATTAASPFSDAACFNASDYLSLSALPPGNVMAPVSIGSHILRYTPHAVVSAGFHRNNEGTLDTLDFFGGDEATARAIAQRRSLDLVVDCGNANAVTLTEYAWLTALPGEGALSLYSINLDAGS